MRRLLNLWLTLVLSLAALLLLAWNVAATPTTHYVAPRADCIGATPCYVTLQAAIDAAASGDEIRVAGVIRQKSPVFERGLHEHYKL